MVWVPMRPGPRTLGLAGFGIRGSSAWDLGLDSVFHQSPSRGLQAQGPETLNPKPLNAKPLNRSEPRALRLQRRHHPPEAAEAGP